MRWRRGVRTFGFYNAADRIVLRRRWRLRAQRGIWRCAGRKAVKRGEQPENGRWRMSRQSWAVKFAGAPEARHSGCRGGEGSAISVITAEVKTEGYYFAPTLLADAKQEDAIVQRGVFGPVVSITRL